MPTPAQAQAAPAQEAEETTFQKFAKFAQVHRHSFSLMVMSNFLQQILFAYLISLVGMIAFLLPARNVPHVTRSWKILWWCQD